MTLGETLGVLSVLSLILLIIIAPFLAIDWITGQHGRLTITAVDKNLFGTYTIYARNSDSAYTAEIEEIRYCIDSDNSELADFARKNIGKPNSTLVYPDKRMGFYLFDKCHSSPIKQIILED
jgi:hypothetical protein